MNIKLIIDNRESIKTKFYHLNPIIKNLDIGDYVITIEEMEVFVIERKTVSDWVQSIKDGRYHEQKLRLMSKYQKNKILFIIEGDIYNDFTLYSSIINTMFRDDFKVFHTTSDIETIILIENLIEKFTKQKEEWLVPKVLDYSSVMINQIVPKKSENQTTERVFSTMLSCIPGISTITAIEISKIFPNMLELCKKIDSFSEQKELEKWITSLEIKTSTGKFKKLGKTGLKIINFISSSNKLN